MGRVLKLVMMLGLVGQGCFRTRDVEPPDTHSSDWVSPTEYSIVLANMERAIAGGYVQNYVRCFGADSLKFFPTAQVYLGNQLLWDTWTWQDEQNWYTNVLAHLGIPTGNYLDFTQTSIQNVTADSVRWVGTYEMVMNHTDSVLPVKLVGQVEFLFRSNAFNEWEIHRWSDYETHIDSSWSRLKLRYVQ